MDAVTPSAAVGYRVAAHGLARRSPAEELPEAAGAIGVQDTPPGTAGQALHARLAHLTPDDVDAAVMERKTLVTTWAMRGAPHLVPFAEAAVFTEGLLPDDEASCLHFIKGASGHLDRFSLSASEAVALTLDELPRALAGKQLTKDELGVALAELVGKRLPSGARKGFTEPDGLGRNTYGESLVRYALYVVALHGVLCIVPRTKGASLFVLAEDWLGEPLPAMPSEEARAEIVRRYLRCHGPSDKAGFAAWAGVSASFASASWDLVAGELTAVDYAGRTAWLLSENLPALATPPSAEGVRLLPPYDPLLATRDRAAFVSEPARQREVWRIQGNPGVVLSEGEIAATWRPHKRGKNIAITVSPMGRLTAATRDAIATEATALAPFRGAANATVDFT
ncbi:winged helix DNA-binding domain-containing protein [Saccharomonospora sp. NPDC006951]